MDVRKGARWILRKGSTGRSNNRNKRLEAGMSLVCSKNCDIGVFGENYVYKGLRTKGPVTLPEPSDKLFFSKFWIHYPE